MFITLGEAQRHAKKKKAWRSLSAKLAFIFKSSPIVVLLISQYTYECADRPSRRCDSRFRSFQNDHDFSIMANHTKFKVNSH
jgi:hypothetical protein